MASFTPPLRTDWTYAEGVREPSSRQFWAHFGAQPRGRSLLKIAGTWTLVDYPTTDQINSATRIVDTNGESVPGAFLGGHVYPVTAAVADELQAAGYSVDDFGGYAGGYGEGY